ncbi:flagellar hook assembly protein FlgD [Bacillus sp. JRC01]|nr:flagellar hook assembly protein FlgD [Bacillus sp. JRC01]
MTKIDPGLLYSNLQPEKRSGANDILGKDDFLKILMTQLQNQDPMNPMQDKDFIAQMATFSSLEQMTNLNKTMEGFVEAEAQSRLISYNSFVGKHVTWHKLSGEGEDASIEQGDGIIKGVRFKNQSVEFIMEDDSILTPANISQVNQTAPGDTALVNATMLIGKLVSWQDGEEVKQGVVQSVSKKDSDIWIHLSSGEKIKPGDLTAIETPKA